MGYTEALMSDRPKRIRAIEGGRVRKDPRAEPSTLPPPPPDSAEAAHSSVIPSAPSPGVPRVSRDDTPAASVPGEVQAHFRHKLAALQSQLADVQRVLAEEQRERAEEADQLARMLKHVSMADTRLREAEERAEERLGAAARQLEEERDVSQQLGRSLTHKEEECVALRGQVLDVQQQLDNAREQFAASEQQLGVTKERLIDVQANEGELKRQLLDAVGEIDALKTARAELVQVKSSLDASQRDAALKAQEVERTNTQLKQAQMKAFAAGKQLESWKVESQRAMEQLRKEHDDAVASLENQIGAVSKKLATNEQLRKALGVEADAVRRELKDSLARGATMRQHLEAAIKMLTLTSQALEAAETAELEIQSLRATQEATRRQILEQALGVRDALKRASDDAPTLDVSEADWSEDIGEK
jgi:chromosome segregation ATPase